MARRPPFPISAALAGLYLAQAIPLYLVAAALPPILRARGVDLAVIGALGILLAPWALKALWAPLVDRAARYPRIGRKGVVLACLAVTIGGIVTLARLDPVADAVRFFPILMLMSLSSATQDIASDGWAVEHLTPAQQPFGNAIQAGAVAGGVLLGGSGTLFLVDVIDWSASLHAVAIVAALAVLPFALIAETAHRRPLPEDYGRAGFLKFTALPGAMMMLAFAFLFRLPEGLVKSLEQPFLVDQGFTLSQIGLISGASAALVGIFGAAAGAVLIQRFGLRMFLVALIIGRTATFAAFFAAASYGIGTWPLVALSGADTFLRYVEIVGLYTAFMRFASLAQAGTDFTLLTSINLMMYMAGSMAAGLMASALGYGPVFGLAVILSGLTGWLALRCLPPGITLSHTNPEQKVSP